MQLLLIGLAVGSICLVPLPIRGGSDFWDEFIQNAGEAPLRDRSATGRAIRLTRIPVGLITATVVTIERARDNVYVRVQTSPDRRTPGATTTTRTLPVEEWDALRPLAESGLWRQKAEGPATTPSVHDGVVWRIEGIRGGEYWAIVRHEPRDAAVLELVEHILRVAGKGDEVPH
jgi:hypothetical protein